MKFCISLAVEDYVCMYANLLLITGWTMYVHAAAAAGVGSIITFKVG
jgi:hypothetical protein